MKAKLRAMLKAGAGRRGGVPCQTCRLKKAAEINEDLSGYASDAEGKRRVPFSALAEYMVQEYHYPFVTSALRKHARKCLRLEV